MLFSKRLLVGIETLFLSSKKKLFKTQLVIDIPTISVCIFLIYVFFSVETYRHMCGNLTSISASSVAFCHLLNHQYLHNLLLIFISASASPSTASSLFVFCHLIKHRHLHHLLLIFISASSSPSVSSASFIIHFSSSFMLLHLLLLHLKLLLHLIFAISLTIYLHHLLLIFISASSSASSSTASSSTASSSFALCHLLNHRHLHHPLLIFISASSSASASSSTASASASSSTASPSLAGFTRQFPLVISKV